MQSLQFILPGARKMTYHNEPTSENFVVPFIRNNFNFVKLFNHSANYCLAFKYILQLGKRTKMKTNTNIDEATIPL